MAKNKTATAEKKADEKAEKTEAPKTEAKAAAPEKPPVHFFCGPRAARDGTTYNEFQKILLATPGLTAEEFKGAIKKGWTAPNSEKFKKSADAFIQGYLTAGLRKKHFVDNTEDAMDAVPVKAETGSAEDGAKPPKLTRAGKELLETLHKATDEHGDTDGWIPRTKVDELLGKPMSQLGKGVIKLEAEKHLEQRESVEGEGESAKKVHHVRITDHGKKALAGPAAEGVKADPTDEKPAEALTESDGEEIAELEEASEEAALEEA